MNHDLPINRQRCTKRKCFVTDSLNHLLLTENASINYIFIFSIYEQRLTFSYGNVRLFRPIFFLSLSLSHYPSFIKYLSHSVSHFLPIFFRCNKLQIEELIMTPYDPYDSAIKWEEMTLANVNVSGSSLYKKVTMASFRSNVL